MTLLPACGPFFLLRDSLSSLDMRVMPIFLHLVMPTLVDITGRHVVFQRETEEQKTWEWGEKGLEGWDRREAVVGA